MEESVGADRAAQPRLGGRKLYFMLKPELEADDVSIGRDRFFEALRTKNLILEPLPKAPRTPIAGTVSRYLETSLRNLS